jgi:glycosyltransferase involved in cell wall biosynthesis
MVSKLKKSLNKTIFLAGHASEIVGPGHHLRDFLVAINEGLTVVLFHPLPGTKLKETRVVMYGQDNLNGKIIKIIKISGGFVKKLLFEFFITIHETLKIEGAIDIYVGINNFDVLAGVLLRGFKVNSVIYYGSDYADRRFKNKIFNRIYLLVEKIAINRSDLVVSNTYRAEKRRLQHGLAKKKSVVIPNGVDLSNIPKLKKDPRYDFVYIGYLSQTHGVMDLVKTIKKLNKDYKEIKLALLGSGPLEEEVKQFIIDNRLGNNIFLIGKLSHKKTLEFLVKNCLVGIASYNKSEGWTKYASPLKVKEYLACGLPVVTSDVPEVANDIKKAKMGYVYKNKNQLYKNLCSFAKDKNLPVKFRKNIANYIKDFDWNDMYKEKFLPYLY